MAPALLFLFVASILPLGGIGGDSMPVSSHGEIGISSDAGVSLTTAAEAHLVRAEATSNGLDPAVAIEAAGIGLEADGDGVRTDAPTRALVLLRDLGPVPTYTYSTPIEGAPTPELDEPRDDEHVVVTGAPAAAPSSDWSWSLPARAAPAAALAAIAVVQADNWMRFVPRGLRYLVPVGGLASMYTRIEKDRVLDHETRAALYEVLQEQPGRSLEELAKALSLTRSTARHHIGVLEQAGLVRSTTEGRCRIHFPAGFEQAAVEQHLLAHPQRQRIVDLLSLEPLSLTELSEVLEANVGAVHFHLKRLSEGGLVQRIENGSVKYVLA